MFMRVSAAWRCISHSRKRRLVNSSGSVVRSYLSAAPGARSLLAAPGRCIGSCIGRSSARLVAVQRLAEKADPTNGSGKDENGGNVFSLSKRSVNGADAANNFKEAEAGRTNESQRSSGLGYIAAGIGAAILLLGVGSMVPTEAGKNRNLSLSSLQKAGSEVGKLIVSTLQTLSNKVSTSTGEVIDAGATALVLLKSLKSVLESYGEGVTKGWWRAKVAAFIADVSAAGGDRRKAVVCASDGVVVDWLLETAAKSHGPGSVVTQGEAARALSYLLEDEATCESVLARPHALPNLLRFAASLPANFRPQTYKQRKRLADIGSSRGKSQLVAAIMEIVTASCEPLENDEFRPTLPGTADPADIAAAIAVVEEGGLQLDEDSKDDGQDRSSGRGIGMKLTGSTGLLALQRLEHTAFLDKLIANMQQVLQSLFFVEKLALVDKDQDNDLVGYGLWDDLQGRYVSVPLAAWALATWAESSAANRSHIARLDKDGQALLAAVLAPERTVKWHGAQTMRLLLENKKTTSDDVLLIWSSALLDMAVQACGCGDSPLAESALSAFTACFKEGKPSHMDTFEKAFPVIRELAKQTKEAAAIQKSIARALETAVENGLQLHADESKKWCGILLRWICLPHSDKVTQSSASAVLKKIFESMGPNSIPVSQALLASLLLELTKHGKSPATIRKEARAKGLLQSQLMQSAVLAATQLGKTITMEARADVAISGCAAELPLADLLGAEIALATPVKNGSKELPPKYTVAEAATAVIKALKALTDISAEDQSFQKRIIEVGGLILLRRLMLADDYEQWCLLDASAEKDWRPQAMKDKELAEVTDLASHIRKHAGRLLTVLTQHPEVTKVVAEDREWCLWLQKCAEGHISGCGDLKSRSYSQMTLLNVAHWKMQKQLKGFGRDLVEGVWPRYEDMVFLLNFDSKFWKREDKSETADKEDSSEEYCSPESGDILTPVMDIVFIHGLAGGPIKTWRVADDKTSTTGRGGLVEKIDEQAGRVGTCWPSEWLSHDLPRTRMLSLKYKTNFSEWSGATLPLEEVSSMLLEKLLAAGVGERPVVFISHSMGGLVVKQMLLQASKDKSRAHLVDQAAGVVFYSCPHFGSRLADMPWRMGYVLRPAPSVAELRSGSPRLEELNRCVRNLHYRGTLQVLSFSETKVTPLVEGYGGWALRMEVVPIESAYPGYGELVVLDGTDHVNSCKPLSPSDPAYTKTLDFLRKIQAKVLDGK